MGWMTARSTSSGHRKNYINNSKQLKPMSIIEIVAPIVVLLVALYFGRDLMKEED